MLRAEFRGTRCYVELRCTQDRLCFAYPLQSGGEAWTLAEKAKIADLNWRIVAEKPRA
jgi:hypothetical protein